jgi:hypothetical protein
MFWRVKMKLRSLIIASRCGLLSLEESVAGKETVGTRIYLDEVPRHLSLPMPGIDFGRVQALIGHSQNK